MTIHVEVTAQAQLGGHTIALVATVPCDPKDIDDALDMMGQRFDRQRAIEQLPEAMVDLVSAEKALKTLPEREKEMAATRAEEVVRQREAWGAAHYASGRRAEFREGAAQKQWLKQHNEETARKREEFAKEKAAHEAAIPALKERITRLEARIAGEDKTEPLRAEMKAAADD